jgi:hypothetical protein
MKEVKAKRLLILGLALVCVLMLGALPAGAVGHYPPGGEGVKAGTVPPPGFHYRTYLFYVNSDELMDNNGDKIENGFDINLFVWVNRFVYMTDYKILGANYGMHLLVPFKNTDIEIGAAGIDQTEFGLGDIVIEPLILSWNKPRYDVAFALAAVVPSGDYSADKPASPGKGYWSGQLTLGGTLYLDEARTWTASLLTRTLWNGNQKDTNITPGWEFVAEWGLGKDLKIAKNMILTPGVRGYGYWQLTEDTGPGSSDNKITNYGIGPEINLFILPPTLLQINLAAVFDFGTENDAKASQFVLTITKSF